jgi:branched-chain amino acid transport system permease protein
MSFLAGVCVLCGIILVASVFACELQKRLGLVCLAYGALIGFGAYGYAIVEASLDSPLIGIVAAACTSAVAGSLLVLLSARAVGDDFALITFALQIAWSASVTLGRPLTGGVLGISGIANVPLSSSVGHEVGPLMVLVVLLIAQLILIVWVQQSGIASTCAVICRSRQLAKSLDIPSSAALGFAGAVWAGFLSFIEPRIFGMNVSVLVLSIGFFGLLGRTSLFVGLIMMVALPQLLRLLDIPGARTGYVQLMITGACLFCGTCLVFRGGSRDNMGRAWNAS